MTAAFFGMEAPAKEAATTLIDYSPKKEYELIIDGEPSYVRADFVNFNARYVSFWNHSPKAGTQDTLVLAVRQDFLEELKEVEL